MLFKNKHLIQGQLFLLLGTSHTKHNFIEKVKRGFKSRLDRYAYFDKVMYKPEPFIILFLINVNSELMNF